jgi:hypothetical protein
VDSKFGRVIAVVLVLSVTLAGCAGVDYKTAPSFIPPKADVQGIVYYESAPFLLVYPDGKGTVNWQVIYLPDQTKKRIAVPHNLVSTLNITLNFENGVLTEADVAADTTALVKAVGTAVQSALPLLLAAASQAPVQAKVYLFRINVDGDKISFVPANNGTPVVVQVPLH